MFDLCFLRNKSKTGCFIRTEHHLVLVSYYTFLGHLWEALAIAGNESSSVMKAVQ